MGFINEGTENHVGDTIEDFGNRHQCADNTGIQPNGVGQVDHDKEGQEGINHVAGDVTGAVTHFVIPFQISFFRHNTLSFSLCFVSFSAPG